MFKSINQIIAISSSNIHSLPQRLGTSSVAIFGTACVVGVFLGVLSMAEGFQKAILATASSDTAIIMRDGATSELNSGVTFEQAQIIANSTGIRKNADNQPIASAEMYVIVDVLKKTTNTVANLPLRGVQQQAFKVRQDVKIVEGRQFRPGHNELIVGRAAQGQFKGLNLNDTIHFDQSDWKIVGIFEAKGSLSESELWSDVLKLQEEYNRGNGFQSMRVKLADGTTAEELNVMFAANPLLNVSVQSEQNYFAKLSKPMATFIRSIGTPIAILMAFGAIFGAINTMYASVSARTRELATLRALGFGNTPILISTMIESLLLSSIGGLIGATMVYLIFNGYTVSTLNGASLSQVVFDFAITPSLLWQGMIMAVWVGLLGGVIPAIHAVRVPVVVALRES